MDRRHLYLSISSESSLGSASVCQIVVCSSPPKWEINIVMFTFIKHIFIKTKMLVCNLRFYIAYRYEVSKKCYFP